VRREGGGKGREGDEGGGEREKKLLALHCSERWPDMGVETWIVLGYINKLISVWDVKEILDGGYASLGGACALR
jgi:hypothetical protein